MHAKSLELIGLFELKVKMLQKKCEKRVKISDELTKQIDEKLSLT